MRGRSDLPISQAGSPACHPPTPHSYVSMQLCRGRDALRSGPAPDRGASYTKLSVCRLQVILSTRDGTTAPTSRTDQQRPLPGSSISATCVPQHSISASCLVEDDGDAASVGSKPGAMLAWNPLPRPRTCCVQHCSMGRLSLRTHVHPPHLRVSNRHLYPVQQGPSDTRRAEM